MTATYSPKDLYELKLRALAEFPVIRAINSDAIQGQLARFRNLRLVSRGGDALNYYFDDFTPTHDWDFGLIVVEEGDTALDQANFDVLVNIAEQIVMIFIHELTNFFANNVSKAEFTGLIFQTPAWIRGGRLTGVGGVYNLNGKQEHFEVIDIYIAHPVQNGVTNVYGGKTKTRGPVDMTGNTHLMSKLKQYDIMDYDTYINSMPKSPEHAYNAVLRRDQHGTVMQAINGNMQIALVKNKVETVVIDNATGINYVAPGDLFNDTLRMIYISMYFINVNPSDNKLVKYVKKLSKLIDLFNGVGICMTGKTPCTAEINSKILNRDTNRIDCNGDRLLNIPSFKNAVIVELNANGWLAGVTPADVWRGSGNRTLKWADIMSSKKLCEIKYMLSL